MSKRQRTSQGYAKSGGYNPYKYGWKSYGRMRRSDVTRRLFGETRASATPEQLASRAEHGYVGRGKYGLRRTLGSFAKKHHLARRAMDYGLSRATGSGMYTGSGLYTPSNDLVQATSAAGSIPSFSSANDETGALTVTHREYIRDVYGNPDLGGGVIEDFLNQKIELNPGIEASFPWLSQVAQNFEEYEFVQLMFTYRSTVADVNSSNGQVGTVIMSTNYNASEPIFPNKSMMMGYAHSSSQKTTDTMLHGVECDPRKLSGSSGKYVRSQGLDPDQDVKTYDHGNFQLAIANTPSGFADNTIGELWVSYTVRLRKPKYFTKEGFGISRDVFRSTTMDTAYVPDTGGVGWFNGTPYKGSHNSIGCTLDKNSGNDYAFDLTFPAHYAGNVRITITATGTGFVDSGLAPWTQTLSGNVVAVHDIVSGRIVGGQTHTGVTENFFMADSNADRFVLILDVRVDIASNSVNNTIVFANSSSWLPSGDVKSCSLEVTEYNSSFGTNSDPAPVFENAQGRVVEYDA